jgi:hypothetical protein
MSQDQYGRTVTQTTANGFDNYAVTDGSGNSFSVSFPTGTSSAPVYSTINAMAPPSFSPSNFVSSFSGSYTPITITSNTFTLTQANDLIEVNKTTGSPTAIILPPMTIDHDYNVIDAKGDAGTNPITITTTNGNGLIDGASNWIIQNNNASNSFVFDGTTTRVD